MGFPLSYSVKAATGCIAEQVTIHSNTRDNSFCNQFCEAFTSITSLQAVTIII